MWTHGPEIASTRATRHARRCLGFVLSPRIALVLPSAIGAFVIGAAVLGAVVLDTRVMGLPEPSIDVANEPDELAIRVAVPQEAPRADGLPTFPSAAAPLVPTETWCSTKIPPIQEDDPRSAELLLADGVLVRRVAVEGGDAILRGAPGGYCMMYGPSTHLEVTTVGGWVVFTRDEEGGAGLFRMRIDGGPSERVASLASIPVEVHGFEDSVVVEYAYTRIGEAYAYPNHDAVPAQIFQITQEPAGVAVHALGDSREITEAVQALSYPRRRTYTDGDVAWMKLIDGREKIVSTRGVKVCTLVEAGAHVIMARFSGWLYYVRESELWRVPVHGGRAQRVKRVPFQPGWIRVHEGMVTAWNDGDERHWELMVGDGSPGAEDKSDGTSCER